MTKQDQLLNWISSKKTVSKHEIIAWGLDNYYLRAERTVRDFVEQGLVERIPDFLKSAHGYTGKDSLYRSLPDKIKDYFQPSLFK